MLHILAVDDELPALEELAYLLRRDARVGEVQTAGDGQSALLVLDRALQAGRAVDAVFLDIGMPGLDGLSLARLLSRFAQPPQVVFVTAHEDHAVEAFALRAADYVLKPVDDARLAEAVRRIAPASSAAPAPASDDERISVELGGVTRFVRRADVLYAEAQGDYARLFTAGASHLVRIPLATLEERWAGAGFVRIHRSHLVALKHVRELRQESGRTYVRLGETLLLVSRRHTRQVRDVLLRQTPASGPAAV
ncbi:Transcriptional regulatory protein YpdB [Streptomyces sp. RB5]|uniref:Transcriptional regulatory protein YpdB n=1 Tax=Streptomyces smaragdinus TaxID=2585196 RepID=A0A7K0CD54_9ACTN|nr:LytTR family DNA-binding domain-containing protein [Streptomyces smaragdinus]MQY11400.1 Transcriptional regulatory protein YpdB [Streptomyces smaragdinus]